MKDGEFLLPHGVSTYLEAWKTEATEAFALLGSYARGDAGPFSDLDIVQFVHDNGHDVESRSFLIPKIVEKVGQEACREKGASRGPLLVVRSTVTPNQVERWFTEPGQAINVVPGIRAGLPLWDPKGYFAEIQSRARLFCWTEELQQEANRLAGEELVGWIEEAHKGLEGLRRNDTGRLLLSRFGLSWGLAWVVRLQRGVFSESDNTFFDDVIDAVGVKSRWASLLRAAFGICGGDSSDSPSLQDEALAGLRLYCETFELLKSDIPEQHRSLIGATARRIRTELAAQGVSNCFDDSGSR